jgi:hypothetical protein
MTADRQKRRLKNKARADRKKIEPHGTKYSGTQFKDCMRNRGQKTDRRNDEKDSIHWKT